MSGKQNGIMFLATGAFSGYIPFASGTFGTVAGLPLCYLMSLLSLEIALPVVVGMIIFSIWIAEEAERLLAIKDPGCIVIDEIAGIMVTMVGIPFTPVPVVFGFLFFSFFDILKIFPLRFLETRIPGGGGIVLDDIGAGLMAHCALRLTLGWMGSFF
jgi:phosphatidylglycerophosphatase A